jgi:hypothetical protein
MNGLTAVVIGLAICGGDAAAKNKTTAINDDLARLLRSWRLLFFECRGERDEGPQRLLFSGDRCTLVGDIDGKATVQLSAASGRRNCDFHFAEPTFPTGAIEEFRLRTIYEIRGDRLSVALCPLSKKRPRRLETTRDGEDDQLLWVFERETYADQVRRVVAEAVMGFVFDSADALEGWLAGPAAERPIVGEIVIVGNSRTPDAMIRKELQFYPGQVVYFWRFRLAEYRLARTGRFEEPRISLDPSSDGPVKDVIILIRERSERGP